MNFGSQRRDFRLVHDDLSAETPDLETLSLIAVEASCEGHRDGLGASLGGVQVAELEGHRSRSALILVHRGEGRRRWS